MNLLDRLFSKVEKQLFLNQIEQHKGIILKVCRIYTDSQDDSDDLQQEIIYQLWKSITSFKGNSKFSSWMYRVALNTAILNLKKERRRVDRYYNVNDSEYIHEGYSEEKDKQLEVFYKAVKELNSIEKALILLYIEGYAGKKIAENLGISTVNVRVKINRTKQKLKEIIKKYNYEF